MSLYYPQGGMTLRVRWEDFGKSTEILDEVYTLPILARNIRVSINDYTEADKFSCEIDYKSFPFDPRCIRSCGVSVHIEDRKSLYKGNVLNILKPTAENTVFIGFADEETIDFDDDKRVVRMEGRDLTSLFIDQKYTGKPISLSKRVDEIVLSLIKEQKATEAITIENKTGEILPIISKLSVDLQDKTSVRNPKRNESYWDIIQSIIADAGLIGYMDRDKFIINKPQKLYNKEKTKHFIYGGNVKKMSLSRKLGRNKGFNVKVISLNLKTKELLTAKIPEEAKSIAIKSPRVTIEQIDKNGKKIEPPKDAPFLTFRIPDIASKDHLINVGEKVYEELSRQQIEGSLTTYEMEVPEITGSDSSSGKILSETPVSFMTIRNGTPLALTISQDDLEMIRTTSDIVQRKKFLIRRGYESKIAEAFAESMNRISSPFYTKSVTMTLDAENGFEAVIDFINFIEIDGVI